MFSIKNQLKFSVVLVTLIWSLYSFQRNGEIKNENLICGRFPKEKDITIDNTVWQVFEHPKIGFIKLLNAYLDERQNQTVVRVNVMLPETEIEENLIFCQFWFGGDRQPFVVRTDDFKILHYFKKKENLKFMWPYFINCPVPDSIKVLPVSVSLVANPCDYAENNLKIINNQPVNGIKKKLAVCSKAATYTDPEFAVRLVEWISWMQILGAEKIYFSYRYLHPKIFEVVKYFESQGIVETGPFYEPSGHRDDARIQKQLIEESCLNDCFYRVKNLYKYVAILDFDEIIIPMEEPDKNLLDVVDRFNGSFYSSIQFQSYLVSKTVTETEEIPENLYTLRHTFLYNRARGPGKSIFNTDRVYVANNHFALSCFPKHCKTLYMQNRVAKVFHYREDVSKRKNCNGRNMSAVARFKNELGQRVENVLKALEKREN